MLALLIHDPIADAERVAILKKIVAGPAHANVDISGLRLRIVKRSCATVARCHDEVFRRIFHKVSAIILRDRNTQRIRMKLKPKQCLNPVEG